MFTAFIKGIFRGGAYCVAGFVGVGIFCTTQQLHYPFADVAVLSSENASNNKLIVHTLSLKDGFVGYI